MSAIDTDIYDMRDYLTDMAGIESSVDVWGVPDQVIVQAMNEAYPGGAINFTCDLAELDEGPHRSPEIEMAAFLAFAALGVVK